MLSDSLRLLLYGVLLTVSNSFLIPHNAGRHNPAPSRKGNSFYHRPGCLKLQQCVDKLRDYHRVNLSDFSILAQGLDVDMIESMLPDVVKEFSSSQSLIKLYSVTNGAKYEDDTMDLQDLWLFSNYFMLSLQEAMELYENFPRTELYNFIMDEYTHEFVNDLHEIEGLVNDFQMSWFPVMSSGMGAYMFLNLSDGHVFEYSPLEDIHQHNELIEYSGIFELFKTIVENIHLNKAGLDIEEQIEQDVVSEIDEKNFENMNNIDLDKVSMDEHRNRRGSLSLKTIIESIQVQTDKHLRKFFNNFGIPLLHISCNHMEMICDLIKKVLEEDGTRRNLCKSTDRRSVMIASRNICGSVKKRSGWDCTAYPFVSTMQAVKWDNATVTMVPAKQNCVLGGQLSAFYKATRRDFAHLRNTCFKLTHP